MALVANPVMVTDHSRIYSRPNADRWDQGYTTRPTAYAAPDFRIRIDDREDHCTVSIDRLRLCVPGNNESCYLAPGMYLTRLMSAGGGLYPLARGEREIRMIVSEEIAQQSRRAEKEHCDDMIRAYNITLLSMYNALRSVSEQLARERFFSHRAAVDAVKERLGRASAHERIARIFMGGIEADGTVNGRFKTEAEKLYNDVIGLTGQRDYDREGLPAWHSFRLARTEYRPFFASCRGYDLGRYEYRKMLLPERIAAGERSPSSDRLIRL